MKKPNLNRIIADNLDKAKFQTKSNPGLPTDGWVNKYRKGSTYKPTELNHYDQGGFIVTDATTMPPLNVPSSTAVYRIDPRIVDNINAANKIVDENDAESNKFLEDWYRGRSLDPRYRDIATDKLNEVKNIKIKPVSAHHLADQNAAAYYRGFPLFFPSFLRKIQRSIYINPYDDYSRSSSVLTHEKTHELDNIVPQKNQKSIIKSIIVPEEKYKAPKELADMKIPVGIKSWYKYFSDPTEVSARLNVFRKAFNLDPTHKYTAAEMKKIMDGYLQNPYTIPEEATYNVKQLFDILGNDPSRLAELNDKIVMNTPKPQTMAKYGGWVDKYKMGGGMFPEYDSYAPPRMNNGGLLSRTVTCSNCGHSWKGVEGGEDVMTCHKCGGMIKMEEGGLVEYGPGGVQLAREADDEAAAGHNGHAQQVGFCGGKP
jgi:hypothetical protein